LVTNYKALLEVIEMDFLYIHIYGNTDDGPEYLW